jgi:AmmeMemoRadiSam system protein A
MFSIIEQQYILSLAHRSIEHFFDSEKILEINEKELPTDELKEKRACFVTLTIDGNLRGCIGHIEPIQPLYLDIIENAVSASFEDQRFNPLSKNEFENVKLEVSILSIPSKLYFSDSQDLLNKLRPEIDGVIIRRGDYGATYLPQVWEDLKNKEEFLSSLCQKAGLPADDWQKSGMEIKVYQAEVI